MGQNLQMWNQICKSETIHKSEAIFINVGLHL